MIKLNPYDALVRLITTRRDRQAAALAETEAQYDSAVKARDDWAKSAPKV